MPVLSLRLGWWRLSGVPSELPAAQAPAAAASTRPGVKEGWPLSENDRVVDLHAGPGGARTHAGSTPAAQEFYIGDEGSQESYIGDEGPQEFYIGDEGPKSFTLATRAQMILTSARRSFRTGTARALICPATILHTSCARSSLVDMACKQCRP